MRLGCRVLLSVEAGGGSLEALRHNGPLLKSDNENDECGAPIRRLNERVRYRSERAGPGRKDLSVRRE